MSENQEFIGHAVIGKTAYKVYRLPVGESSRKAGILGNYALEGPRGACYFVTDHGPKFKINSCAVGGARPWNVDARPLRGLTRESISLFLDDPSRTV